MSDQSRQDKEAQQGQRQAQPQSGAKEPSQRQQNEDEQGSAITGSAPQSGSRTLEHDQQQDMEGNKTQRNQEDKLGTDKDGGGARAIDQAEEERGSSR